jgi:hypothetical protein
MWLLLAIVGLVTILTALALIVDWRQKRSLRALGEPRLEVAPAPCALGDRVRCRLTGTARSRLRVEHATFTLVCSEHVQWTEIEQFIGGHGEETKIPRRASEEVWVHDQRMSVRRDLQPGEVLELQAEFELPLDGPPSFRAAHNQVLWSVTCRASVAKAPDAVIVAGVEVAASRRPSARARGSWPARSS